MCVVLSLCLLRWQCGRDLALSATWVSNEEAEMGPRDVPASMSTSPRRSPTGPTCQSSASAGRLGHPGTGGCAPHSVFAHRMWLLGAQSVDPAGADGQDVMVKGWPGSGQGLSSAAPQGWVDTSVRGKPSCVWHRFRRQCSPCLERGVVVGVDPGWWPWQQS